MNTPAMMVAERFPSPPESALYQTGSSSLHARFMAIAAPDVFAQLVHRIRTLFLDDPLLELRFTDLPHRVHASAAACAAAIAVLINEGFLAWWDDRLTRADARPRRVERRTA
jgi:hypothetical protein